MADLPIPLNPGDLKPGSPHPQVPGLEWKPDPNNPGYGQWVATGEAKAEKSKNQIWLAIGIAAAIWAILGRK